MDTRLLCLLVLCMAAYGMTFPIPIRAVKYGEETAKQHYLPGIQVTHTCKLFEEGSRTARIKLTCNIPIPRDSSKMYYCSSNSPSDVLTINYQRDQDVCHISFNLQLSDPLNLNPEGILYEVQM